MDKTMTKFSQQLTNIITDPFNGPFEGEDYWIDDTGIIQVAENNVRLAAIIMRKANLSGEFDKKLVKIGAQGDSILLGFDSLTDTAPVYSAKIGYKGDMLAEVRADESGKFCLYINGKRGTKMYAKLSAVKSTIKKLDREMQFVGQEPEDLDD
jgi:hypothetical protein